MMFLHSHASCCQRFAVPRYIVGRSFRMRLAVTLLEVIFAIGIALIGLVGLLSILPLAGNRAVDAVSLIEAADFGDSVLKRIQAKGLVRNEFLVDSTGTLVNTSLAQASDGFCIDPLFFAAAVSDGLAAVENYDPFLYPPYLATHDPLTNPASGGTVAAQPRLTRLGINNPAGINSLEHARHFGENPDDLYFQRPEDRSLPPTMERLVTDGLAYGKTIPTGSFTWIATVDPARSSSSSTPRFASLSVVVLRDRDYQYGLPTSGEVDPEKNLVAERVASVTLPFGFTGGSGGQVTLSGSVNVSSDLRSGDWLMLSSNPSGTDSVHRWYRVAVPGEVSEVAGVWQRTVALDGPDWSFAGTTVATLVEDVVSVTERLVRIGDL